MTDPFTPLTLSLAADTDAIARATNEDTAEFLQGYALRAVIAERIEQIQKHGHTLSSDIVCDQAELALAAKAYLDTAIDLALRPDIIRRPGDVPESWPWAPGFWKEPFSHQRLKALEKAAALILAEIDREHFAQQLLQAARPLGSD